MSTWQDLRDLRDRGQRPAMAVCITTNYFRCIAQANDGAMVIVHKPGERFEADLLDGLDVEVHLDDCGQATLAARLLRERDVTPTRFSVWCRCWDEIGSFWNRDCKTGADIARAWDTPCAT